MKQSTSILRGMNDIRADYILESELPDMATAPTVAPRSTARETWQRITSSGWFVAAVCAIVAFGTLAGIIWAGQRGPGVVTPAGTVAESTAEETESIIKDDGTVLLRETRSIHHLGSVILVTMEYVYEYDTNGNLLTQTTFSDGDKTGVETYTYNSKNLLIKRETNYFSQMSSIPPGQFKTVTTYEYDGHDRLIKESARSVDGTRKSEIIHEYDEKGNLIRSEGPGWVLTRTYIGNNSYAETTVFQSDSVDNDMPILVGPLIFIHGQYTSIEYNTEVTLVVDGRILREECYQDSVLVMRTEYEYADYAQGPIRELYYANGELYQTVHYEHNESGKWIKKEVCYVNDTVMSTVISTAEREYGPPS